MTASFIYDAVRTLFGRAGGALAGIRPDDLAAVALRALVDRTGLDPSCIDDVLLGDANQAGRTTETSPASPRCSPASRPRCPGRR